MVVVMGDKALDQMLARRAGGTALVLTRARCPRSRPHTGRHHATVAVVRFVEPDSTRPSRMVAWADRRGRLLYLAGAYWPGWAGSITLW
jgi:hypothetical protein